MPGNGFDSVVKIEKPLPFEFPFTSVVDGTRTNKGLELRVWIASSTLFVLRLGVWKKDSSSSAPRSDIEGILPAGSTLLFGQQEVTLSADFDGRGTVELVEPNSSLSPYPVPDERVVISSIANNFQVFEIWGSLDNQDIAQSVEQTAGGPILIVAVTASYAFRIEDYEKVQVNSFLTDYEGNQFKINGITLNSSRKVFEVSAFREVGR